jgi:hypothetical protein
MSNYKEIDETLALVKDFATIEQVQTLLRTRKESVRITGENKDQIVDRNLREAIESRAIGIEKVFDLIRDAEENGSQHIFYYKAKTRPIANALAFDEIAPRMFGRNWEKTLEDDFPKIKLVPNEFQVSDFRRLEGKPKDWIFKIYGQTIVEKSTAEEEPEGTTALWRKFTYESLRIVLLARWNSGPDLLEIRVQRDTSRRRVEGWHNVVWSKINPHIVRRQFDPWALAKMMTSIINKHSANEKLYKFRGAKLSDSAGNQATFETETETGNLFETSEMRQSLESLMKNPHPEGLIVTWLAQNDLPPKDMRTILGVKQLQEMRSFVGEFSNEMIVPAHCRAKDLDYVTGQLRTFSK